MLFPPMVTIAPRSLRSLLKVTRRSGFAPPPTRESLLRPKPSAHRRAAVVAPPAIEAASDTGLSSGRPAPRNGGAGWRGSCRKSCHRAERHKTQRRQQRWERSTYQHQQIVLMTLDEGRDPVYAVNP